MKIFSNLEQRLWEFSLKQKRFVPTCRENLSCALEFFVGWVIRRTVILIDYTINENCASDVDVLNPCWFVAETICVRKFNLTNKKIKNPQWAWEMFWKN